MKKDYLAYSSKRYLLNVEDVAALNKSAQYQDDTKRVVILLANDKTKEDTLLSGVQVLEQCRQNNQDFVKVRIAYYTYNPVIGFLLHLIKPIKRKTVVVGSHIYRTKLSWLLKKKLARGVRNRENAYALKNKKWYIPEQERQKRFDELYNSLKNGYNMEYPMFVGLNRHWGYKDQLLQGHHRIGICKELNIEDVSISFWTYPQSVFNCRRKKK